jgi:hypothetical protein
MPSPLRSMLVGKGDNSDRRFIPEAFVGTQSPRYEMDDCLLTAGYQGYGNSVVVRASRLPLTHN